MEPSGKAQATDMLVRARQGDPAAAAHLMPLVYGELRTLAAIYLRRERGGHTLEPTALVNEAFLRLVDSNALEEPDQAHFLAIAANVMRRVLVEHARAKAAQKRGGCAERVTLDTSIAIQASGEKIGRAHV